MSVKYTIGVCFLAAQLIPVIQARFVPSRWLCWAPGDYAVQYEIEVQSRGRALEPSEIQKRYGLASQGWYENPPANIMDIVRQYEQTLGKNDAARVVLTYRLDGGEKQQWRWAN